MRMITYNRDAALAYAHKWAYARNPAYYDFEDIGGDCTNYASQCLYHGVKVFNFTPVFGWFYVNANYKAPAWTGVEYFYNFMTRKKQTAGPFGEERPLTDLQPGDFAQLRFNGKSYGHTPIIVAMGQPPTLQNTLVAAHSFDADWRPLDTYDVIEMRFIHIIGAYQL